MNGRCYGDSDRIKHFKADRSEGLTGEDQYVEVRYDSGTSPDDGDQRTIDEICTRQVHLEMMDLDNCWMSICGLHVSFRAVRVKGSRRPHLVVTCYPSSCTPHVVPPGEGSLERHYAAQQARGATNGGAS